MTAAEPSTDTAAPRQLLPREERRAQLLRAAATAFAGGGYAATSMDDVAAVAGVTKLIVYRHFESKEELYRAVLESVSDRLRTNWAASMARPLPERRGGTVRALLAVAREDPDGYRLLVFHAPRESQFEKQAFGYWEESVEGVDALLGAHVREPALRSWVVRSVMGYVLHSVLLWLETGDPRHDEAFVEGATAGLDAQVAAWTDLPRDFAPPAPG
jgi:AcrR family transcriptional regulator